MELNLDSFLDPQNISDDDDDDFRSLPHRTIDEILNDCDDCSTSSSSSPSSHSNSNQNRSFSDLLLNSRSSKDSLSVFPSKTTSQTELGCATKSEQALHPTQFDDKLAHSKSTSLSRVKPSELADDPFRRRPFGSLLSGVRSNVKPGEALAAAAAASRSMPTPHAAAIKSRRTVSENLRRVAGGGELVSVIDDECDNASSGDSNGVDIELGKSGEKLNEGELKFHRSESGVTVDFTDGIEGKYRNLGSAGDSGKDLSSRDVETREKNTTEIVNSSMNNSAQENSNSTTSNSSDKVVSLDDSSFLKTGEDVNLDNKSAASGSNGVEDEDENESICPANEIDSRTTKDSAMFTANDSSEKVSLSFPEEELSTTGLERQDLKSSDYCLEDDINNLSAGDNDSSCLRNDITVLEELGQLESKKAKGSEQMKSQKPLELAEELEKKQAYTGLHWEEGAAAQPMRLEGVGSGSTPLGYFNIDADNVVTQAISSQGFRREHGSPQVVAVHANYIAVGMARGIIVVLPSKYSPYHADNMDGKMALLGLQGDRLLAPVTSMCFNQQGDLLLAGYSDGHVTLWDVQRSVAKLVTGEHSAPVVHTLFLGQDSMNTRQFKAVTGDSKGVVLLLTISVVPLLNRFTIKTQCLLDGQKTGIVLSASPLLDESVGSASLNSQGNSVASTSGIGSMMGGVVGSDAGWKLFNEGSSMVEEGVVVFVTHQTALVVRLSPTLEIYAQISKPDGMREGAMPYTAWKCATNLRGSHSENIPAEAAERVSLLALAWDNNVQVAMLVKSGLKVSAKWSLDSAVIGLAWLDDQMLVVLTSSGQLFLCTRDGSVIHQTSFTVECFGVDDIVAYHPHFINQFGNPEKAHHNSIAVRGASIYILAPTHVLVARLLPWKERIHVLRKAGDWEGALNMSLTLYDGQAHGVIDLPRGINAVHEAIMPYLEELLLSYVDEVFSYISVAFCNQMGKVDHVDDTNGSSTVHAEIKEQYNRVGGVAVEFCVHIKRTDILFDEIFSKFVRVQQRDVFLELLEPYILKDLLGCLPPEIMQALVEHYSTKGWLQRVEQCVLHMDISSLDFNQVVRLCREHALYGALVYLFNKGLDDYRAPLEELLAVLRSSRRETATALGYRILVYLKYCFSGLAFPPGHGTIAPARLPSLRKELLHFLLEDCGSLNPQANASLTSRGTYPNLYYLLGIDTEATLSVLRYGLAEDETPNMNTSSNGPMNGNMDEKRDDEITRTWNILLQKIVDALAFVLDKGTQHKDLDIDGGVIENVEDWPSMEDIGHLFEFIAYYVSLGRCKVSKGVLCQILEYLASDSNFRSSVSGNSSIPNRREKQVLGLLTALPDSEWNASYVLGLCEKAQFYQVCGLIHTLRNKHLDALDSYMKDVNEPIHAFSFVNKTLFELTGNDCVAFRLAVISRIPQLVDLSREATFFLILSHFNDENSDILTELKSHPRSLFLYLKTLIEVYLSGNLNFPTIRKEDENDAPQVNLIKDQPHGLVSYMESLSNFPNFLRDNPIHVTDDVIELYLELLCQYERESVLKFLETFDSYRMEHCLRLCQEYGIIDAAAFLLERVGDVGSALLLVLSCLNDKFTELDVAVEAIVSRESLSTTSNRAVYSAVLKMKEVNDINNIIHSCILMCQRNTPRLNPEEAETYWFKLLDSFCEPLMDSHNASEGEDYIRMPNISVNSLEDNEKRKIKWRISKTYSGLHILRKLFSQFIKEIVEAMIGYVRLPTIMSKLLTDNGSQEFGDFKLTILGMLGTYGFERRILDTAKSLIEDDTFYTMNVLKRGASHGYAPRSFTCCICNSLLSKNSSSGIRVFSCGHASHLHCEVMENGASSQGSTTACPVCMPKRKTQQSRNKLVLAEDSLVSTLSRRRQEHGNNMYPHESDLAENAYSPQLMSRFEILSKLHKNQNLIQIESIPQLRLAPPAVYHEKVNRVADFQTGESSTNTAYGGKSSTHRLQQELRSKRSSLRFPLRSSIFGKEKMSKQ